MNTLARCGGPTALALGWLLLCRCNAVPVVAQSSLSFSNVQITPSSGSLSFSPWSAEAFADANGSSAFSSTSNGVTPASASVSFGFATASSSAAPLTLTGSAASSVNLPDGVAASAFATGRSSLYSTFIVTGGTGSVDVTFSVNITANLSVVTSNLGVSASTETVFALELDGSPILFRHDALSIGPSASQNLAFSTTLTSSRSLQFGTSYFVFLQPDSESRGVSTVPESTTILVYCGLAAVGLTLLQLAVNLRKPAATKASIAIRD